MSIVFRLVTSTMVKSEKAPAGKKPVDVRDTKYLMVPVSLEDYERIDKIVQQLSENREIQKYPHRPHSQVIQAVKDERLRLQIEHNPGLVTLLVDRRRNLVGK